MLNPTLSAPDSTTDPSSTGCDEAPSPVRHVYSITAQAEPSVLARRLVRVTRESLFRGMEQVRPGASLGDIGKAIQRYVESHNYSVVREYCGHGIGEKFHEEPQVLHYGSRGPHPILEPGMCFTIEPMVNVGRRHVKLQGDGWTVVTKDRSLSAQWEHTLLVTESGYEILTLRREEREELGLT